MRFISIKLVRKNNFIINNIEELKKYATGNGKIHYRTGHEDKGGEYGYSSTLSLTSALDGVGGQRHVLAPLPPGKTAGVSFTGGWLRPRAGLDRCGKCRHHRDWISGQSCP